MSNQHLHQLKIRCPACDTGQLAMTPETALSVQCDHCQAGFPLAQGFLDPRPETSQHRTFSQKLMEWEPLVNRYESRWWRSGFFAARLFGISFREEQSLIFQLADLQGDERVLDLACGPGTYTLPFAADPVRSLHMKDDSVVEVVINDWIKAPRYNSGH
jgi:hypothetical protein